ncbi:MAG: hypothetical protein WC564_04275 [Patescibacteria group bacterium]
MEEQKHHKHHEQQCCGGHHGKTMSCNCLSKPWMRLLILFCAALVVFYIGVCVGVKANKFQGDRFNYQKSGSQNFECPMRRL